MKILIVADTLLTGGAEGFLLRQYNYLKENGHTVLLFITRPDHVEKRMLQNFPEVHYISPAATLVRIVAQVDRAVEKLFKRNFFLNILNKIKIKSVIRKFNPDVIQSHLLQADYKVFLANRKNPVHHVITVHGDYIELIRKNNTPLFNRIKKVLCAVDSIVVISSAHQVVLSHFLPSINHKLVKIYNGYPLSKGSPSVSIHKGFCFCMIARGIPEKGWEATILAFLKLNNRDSRLVLFGESKYLDQLGKKYTDARIQFMGFTNDPLNAIKEIDVGIFASFIQSEGLPTTIIEYLLLNKPVITTNVGESAEMIRHNDKCAGIVLELKNGRPDVDELAAAMQRIMTDKNFYEQCSLVASDAKKKFRMENCMQQYLEVYKKVTE